MGPWLPSPRLSWKKYSGCPQEGLTNGTVKEGQWDARDAIFARTDTDIDSPLYLIPMAGERLLWGWPSISKKGVGFRNPRRQPSQSRRHILNILEPSETGRTGRRPTPSPCSQDRRRQVQCHPRSNGGPCLPRPSGGPTVSSSLPRWASFSRPHGTRVHRQELSTGQGSNSAAVKDLELRLVRRGKAGGH